MPDDLLRDLEVLRDKWDGALGSRYYSKQLTALLAKHATPAGPDLREMVLALIEDMREETCSDDDSGTPFYDASLADDIIRKYFASLAAATEQKAAAPAAPKEWRGPWRCERCEVTWDTKPDNHEWFDVPCGPVVPYERRKGGEG